MPIEYYIDIVRFVDIAMILLVILLFSKNWERDQNVKIGIFYLISVICYLLVNRDITSRSFYFYFLVGGSFSLPILFWFFSKSIFDDDFKIGKAHLWYYVITIVVYYSLFYYTFILEGRYFDYWYTPIINSGSQIISFVFIVFGIGEAYRGRLVDLLESRIKFRTTFILVTGFLIIFTLIGELVISHDESEGYLSLLQKISIGIILFVFFYFLIEFKSGFFFERQKPISNVQEANPVIVEKLNTLIKVEKIYLQEGLTIRKLAERMNEQEYKVRRYINQHLNFRNFNDFLNSHRIQDACEILLDEHKSDLTILEIAYKLGFNSIGPFNKAFKIHTGTTPTAYRKQA